MAKNGPPVLARKPKAFHTRTLVPGAVGIRSADSLLPAHPGRLIHRRESVAFALRDLQRGEELGLNDEQPRLGAFFAFLTFFAVGYL